MQPRNDQTYSYSSGVCTWQIIVQQLLLNDWPTYTLSLVSLAFYYCMGRTCKRKPLADNWCTLSCLSHKEHRQSKENRPLVLITASFIKWGKGRRFLCTGTITHCTQASSTYSVKVVNKTKQHTIICVCSSLDIQLSSCTAAIWWRRVTESRTELIGVGIQLCSLLRNTTAALPLTDCFATY